MAVATGKKYDCTAEDIIRERDELAQSWRKVGEVLGLGSPGNARAAYTALTGKPHTESSPIVRQRAPRADGAPRARRGSAPKKVTRDPKWHDDSNQDEIAAKMEGALITLERAGGREEIRVQRVIEFEFNKKDELMVHFRDALNSGWRTCYVRDIVEVRS